LGYQHDGDGRVGVAMCSKAWTQVEELFVTCEKIVSRPLNGMVALAPNGPLK
jgi:hypothetical protein